MSEIERVLGLVFGTGSASLQINAPQMALRAAVVYLAMILIGGTDSIIGALLGAAIITWLPRVTSDVTQNLFGNDTVAPITPQISQILYGVLIVACILVSPKGIVGWIGDRIERLGSARSRTVEQPRTDPLPSQVGAERSR